MNFSYGLDNFQQPEKSAIHLQRFLHYSRR